MRDGHRVLVGAADRLGNAAQLARLQRAGYRSPVSFEPFADGVALAGDIETRLAASTRHLQLAVGTAA
jgi:2-keto-myo-inositol isomerase